MVKIGKKLRKRREELGLRMEDVSLKTKLTVNYIKAIEAGDIAYFKDDLSYLPFFLRSYCNALDMNFDEIKEELHDSIEDYTASFSVEKLRQHREIEKNVRKHIDITEKPEVSKKKSIRRNRKKIDISMVSFIIIVLLIILALMYAVYTLVMQGDKDSLQESPPMISDVSDTPDAPEEEIKPIEEKKPFAITKVSDIEYTLDHLKDGDEIAIEIVFGSFSQFNLSVDDVIQSEPTAQVYNYKDVLHVKRTAHAGMKLSLGFGFMQSNTITINGIPVELENSIKNTQAAVTLNFIVKGE